MWNVSVNIVGLRYFWLVTLSHVIVKKQHWWKRARPDSISRFGGGGGGGGGWRGGIFYREAPAVKYGVVRVENLARHPHSALRLTHTPMKQEEERREVLSRPYGRCLLRVSVVVRILAPNVLVLNAESNERDQHTSMRIMGENLAQEVHRQENKLKSVDDISPPSPTSR